MAGAVNDILVRRLRGSLRRPSSRDQQEQQQTSGTIENSLNRRSSSIGGSATSAAIDNDAAAEVDNDLCDVLGSLGGGWRGEEMADDAATPYIVKFSSWNILGADVLLRAAATAATAVTATAAGATATADAGECGFVGDSGRDCSGSGASRVDVGGGNARPGLGGLVDAAGAPGAPPALAVPWVFIYRDPVEVAASELSNEGGWLRLARARPVIVRSMLARRRPWGSDCGDHHDLHDGGGVDDPSLALDTDVAILSNVLRGYFQTSLDMLDSGPHCGNQGCSSALGGDEGSGGGSGRGWVVNYSDLIEHPDEMLAKVYLAVTGGLDDATGGLGDMTEASGESSRLRARIDRLGPVDPSVLSRHSKAGGKQPHQDDRASKQRAAAAVPGLADAVRASCAAPYAALEAHPRRLRPGAGRS